METDKTTAGPTIAFVHILRGLASLLVVWAHLSGYWLALIASTSPMQDAWEDWIVRPFHLYVNGGHLGVLVFFLISGYIITHTSMRENRKSFLVKRVFRIFPVLFVATVVMWLVVKLLINLDLPLLGMRAGTPWEWIQAVFLIDGFTMGSLMLPPTWTLIIEISFYALVFVVLNRQRVSPLVSTWIMIAIWMVACMVSLNVPFIYTHANGFTAFSVGFLILGRLIYFWQRDAIARTDVVIAFTVTLLSIAGFFEAANPGYLLKGQVAGVEPVVTWILALIIFVAFMRAAPKRAPQPLAFLGDISYSLYLLHIPVGFLALNVLHHFNVDNTLSFFISLAITLAASYVSFRLVEKPAQKLARRILKRPETPAKVQPELTAAEPQL